MKDFCLLFSDIENVILPFDGSSSQNVHNWISNFDDVTIMFNSSELQKIIYAKRSLRERAKLLVETEHQINSFDKLKQVLLSEIGITYNFTQLHDMLNKRKLQEN